MGKTGVRLPPTAPPHIAMASDLSRRGTLTVPFAIAGHEFSGYGAPETFLSFEGYFWKISPAR